MKRLNQLGIELPENLFARRQLTPDSSIGPMSNVPAPALTALQEDQA